MKESSLLEEPGVKFCYLSEPELCLSVTVVVNLLFLFFSLAGISEQKSEGSVCCVLIPAVSVFCCEFVVYPCYEKRKKERDNKFALNIFFARGIASGHS